MNERQLAMLCALLSEYRTTYGENTIIEDAFFTVWETATASNTSTTVMRFHELTNEMQAKIGQEVPL